VFPQIAWRRTKLEFLGCCFCEVVDFDFVLPLILRYFLLSHWLRLLPWLRLMRWAVRRTVMLSPVRRTVMSRTLFAIGPSCRKWAIFVPCRAILSEVVFSFSVKWEGVANVTWHQPESGLWPWRAGLNRGGSVVRADTELTNDQSLYRMDRW